MNPGPLDPLNPFEPYQNMAFHSAAIYKIFAEHVKEKFGWQRIDTEIIFTLVSLKRISFTDFVL